MAVCPHCHQHIAVERLGVRLSPLKARIFDAIEAAGDGGISSADLREQIAAPLARWQTTFRARNTTTIRVHINQINNVLVGTDWMIRSEGCSRARRWHLRRRKQEGHHEQCDSVQEDRPASQRHRVEDAHHR